MDDLAARRPQRVELQGQGLIIGRNAGIADFHARIMRAPFYAIQPFLVQGLTGANLAAQKGSVVRGLDVVSGHHPLALD